MLEVQKFLRNPENSLRKLSQQYNIQCNICTELDLVSLNYTSLSDLSNPMVRECKGLFLEIGIDGVGCGSDSDNLESWNIACKSFGNFPQGTSQGIDWDSAKLLEKLDGALVCIYFYKDAWRIGMRMSADGSMQVTAINGIPTSLSFAELTKLTLNDMGYDWEDYASKLNPKIFYSFELIGPETRVGVIYSKRKLVFIGAVDSKTLADIDIFKLEFPIEKPVSYPVYSLDDINKVVASHDDPLKYEGFILHDSNYNRKKIMNPNYLEMMSDPVSENDLSQLEDMLLEVLAFTTPNAIVFTNQKNDNPLSLDAANAESEQSIDVETVGLNATLNAPIIDDVVFAGTSTTVFGYNWITEYTKYHVYWTSKYHEWDPDTVTFTAHDSNGNSDSHEWKIIVAGKITITPNPTSPYSHPSSELTKAFSVTYSCNNPGIGGLTLNILPITNCSFSDLSGYQANAREIGVATFTITYTDPTLSSSFGIQVQSDDSGAQTITVNITVSNP